MATVIEIKRIQQELFKQEVETTDMALSVRTSDEAMLDWDRQRIVDALMRETYVDFDTAREIPREVEDLIATSKITPPTHAKNSHACNQSENLKPRRRLPHLLGVHSSFSGHQGGR